MQDSFRLLAKMESVNLAGNGIVGALPFDLELQNSTLKNNNTLISVGMHYKNALNVSDTALCGLVSNSLVPT